MVVTLRGRLGRKHSVAALDVNRSRAGIAVPDG